VIGGSALQLTTVKVDFRLSAILFQALEDPWDIQPRPVVDALPDPTTQNKEVDVMGNDFPATQSVQVKLAGQPKATVTSQSDGSFTVRIQANVPSGDQPVVATAQTAAQETGTTSLTVLPAPTPTPPAALPPLMLAAIAAVIAPAIRVAKRTRQH